jgi:hypothetical protein
VDAKAMGFVKLLPMLTQEAVYNYIIQNKHRFTELRDIILTIQTNVQRLSTEGITALTLVASAVGGAPWIGLPDMFRRVDEANRAEVMLQL